MAGKAAIDRLIHNLADYRTRSDARKELVTYGEEAAEPLMQLLQDKEQKTNARWAAIRILADIGHQPAEQPIFEVARESENLCGEACRALKTITGKEFGEDLEKWQAYLNGEAPPEEDAADVQEEAEGESPDQEQDATETEDSSGETLTLTTVPPEQDEYELIKNALASETKEIAWEEENYIHVHLAVTNERSHQLIISFAQQEENNQRIVAFYTRCGRDKGDTDELISYCNNRLTYGQAYIETEEEGEHILAVWNTTFAENLTADKVRQIVVTLAKEADAIEAELTNKDRI